jgi:hypothetical protein
LRVGATRRSSGLASAKRPRLTLLGQRRLVVDEHGGAGTVIGPGQQVDVIWGQRPRRHGGGGVASSVDPDGERFEVPEGEGIAMHHIMTVNLSAGTISHVVNGAVTPSTSPASVLRSASRGIRCPDAGSRTADDVRRQSNLVTRTHFRDRWLC